MGSVSRYLDWIEIVNTLRAMSDRICEHSEAVKVIIIPENSEGIVPGKCTIPEIAGMIHFIADMME